MSTVSDLVQLLGSVKHFQRIKPEELARIVLDGRVQVYQAGEFIFQEGSPNAGLFVLLNGQIQLCKHSPLGQNAILSIFEPVIMFNEVAALDRGPNPVTAIAVGPVQVWRLEADHLDRLIIQYPHIGLGLLRILAARNRHLVAQFEDLSFRSVLARAAKLLIELSANGTLPIDRHRHPVYQMAARIATVPEAFSRTLKVFRTNGDIRSSGSVIEVVNLDHLKDLAEINAPVV